MIDVMNNISISWWGWMSAMFWQVSLLIVLVACIDILIRRWTWPQLRYALWLLVVVKLIIPPGVSMHGSLVERVKPGLDWIISSNIKEPSTIAEYSPFIISDDPFVVAQRAPIQRSQAAFTLSKQRTDVVTSSAKMSESSSVKLIWQSYAMAVWLLGVALLGFWLFQRLRKLRVCQSRNDPASAMPQSFHMMMSRCAQRLKLSRIPRVVVTKKVVCPAVLGVFRPVLLMPKGYLSKLSRKDAEHMLLHELAHIKRCDPVIHSLYLILQIVYWFNPLLWLARRQLIHLRELCCDATVARILKHKTNAYRQTLIDIARQFLTKPVEPGLGLLGLFEDANKLLVRLSWLEKKSWRYQKMKNLTVITIITLMLVFVLPMAKAQEHSSTEDQTVHSEQSENPAALEIEHKQPMDEENFSEEMEKLRAELEKLETQKQNLQKELAALEISHLSHLSEKASEALKKAKAAKDEAKAEKDKAKNKSKEAKTISQQMEQWQNSEEFKQWQQEMQQWQNQMQQWQQQFEHSIQEHGIIEEAPELPMDADASETPSPLPMPHPVPVIPPMPEMPPISEMPAMPPMPEITVPVDVPKVVIPKINIPTIQVPANIAEHEDSRFVATKEMEFIAKVQSGAELVVENKIGKIILVPSKDGNCNVKADIRAKAETTEEAQEMVEQVAMNNESSSERFFLKPVKSGDDNWNNLSVDFYITVPSNIPIDISTDIGSIEITDLKTQIKAVTNVGSISAVNVVGEIQLTTNVGDIEFAAPNDFSAQLQAKTQVGSIESEFPMDISKIDFTASKAKGTIGSGEKSVSLKTEVGKIIIKKSF